jgi:hypothetical protein
MSERAIIYFHELSNRDDTTPEALHYYRRAVQALEKQVPMLVNHERTFWHYYHYCPACAEQLRIEALKYCDHCGQRLDWSNYELGLKYVR